MSSRAARERLFLEGRKNINQKTNDEGKNEPPALKFAFSDLIRSLDGATDDGDKFFKRMRLHVTLGAFVSLAMYITVSVINALTQQPMQMLTLAILAVFITSAVKMDIHLGRDPLFWAKSQVRDVFLGAIWIALTAACTIAALTIGVFQLYILADVMSSLTNITIGIVGLYSLSFAVFRIHVSACIVRITQRSNLNSLCKAMELIRLNLRLSERMNLKIEGLSDNVNIEEIEEQIRLVLDKDYLGEDPLTGNSGNP